MQSLNDQPLSSNSLLDGLSVNGMQQELRRSSLESELQVPAMDINPITNSVTKSSDMVASATTVITLCLIYNANTPDVKLQVHNLKLFYACMTLYFK